MSSIDPIGAAGAPLSNGQDEKLRRAAKDLEGVFVAELFKAMRQTVPQDGITDGGMGEEMFTEMLDQHLAPLTSEGWQRGIGDALYRQLRGAIAAQSNGEGGTE
ncbi:MAG: rod-binding protein [Gemmatimonadota bacterium]